MRMLTQTMISAYENCRRYYYLKYVRELAWPAVTGDREAARRGADFHLLVRQLIMGFPKTSLVFPPDDEAAESRIDSWIRADLLKDYDKVWAEREVTAIFGDTLLLGKFDALALRSSGLTIFDWKTTDRRPEAAMYADSPQTRLYRWLIKAAGPRLLGYPDAVLPAESIEMIYWFPAYPDQAVRLPYSERSYEEDQTWLRMKIRELSLPDEKDYPETEKTKRCRTCGYYAFCHPEEASHFGQAARSDPENEARMAEDIFQSEFDFLIPDDENQEAVSY